MRKRTTTLDTKKLTYLGLFTAIVVVLQVLTTLLGLAGISLPITLALPPIILGAAFCGPLAGAWLGLVMGITVLFQPATAAFMEFSAVGTVITVLLKSTAAGFVGGILYRLIAQRNRYVGVAVAAVATPVVNTGLFLLGCTIFFRDFLRGLAGEASLVSFMFLGLVGVNFLVELAVNLVLCPVIVRLVSIGQGKKSGEA